MEFGLLLLMLTACAAAPQDLSGKMFTFQKETATDHVKLTASRQDFGPFTVCHRSFTALKRGHPFFSMATSSHHNAFMVYWDPSDGGMGGYIRSNGGPTVTFGNMDYKPNMWHSICTTWDSKSGLMQLWLDGQPSMRLSAGTGRISGPVTIVLGQDQDSRGGGFELSESFQGMMSDVHMWDSVLPSCEIRNYMDDCNFMPGNVLNWSELEYQITGAVLVGNKEPPTCRTSCSASKTEL